ncbi:hypothetical protein ABT003_33645, partial [Streptosporangium roseum]
MILGVDLGWHAPVVAAVRDGALTEAGAAVRAVSVAVDLDTVRRARVAAIRVAGPCPPGGGPQAGGAGGGGVGEVVRGGHTHTGGPNAEE